MSDKALAPYGAGVADRMGRAPKASERKAIDQ